MFKVNRRHAGDKPSKMQASGDNADHGLRFYWCGNMDQVGSHKRLVWWQQKKGTAIDELHSQRSVKWTIY